MAKIVLDGVELEAEAGAPLVEVIKQSGTFISNLCYLDGQNPYAGCRTCLVEIEGVRGLQLACTSRINEGMSVRTNTGVVLDARQAVLSIINANHSDRCLTCHRRVHCQPGDICLRDDTVTHRCLTCAKNFRCELQTTNEMLHMGGYEPWLGEERTYYETEVQPEADRANPFLEFDPQMCIICTRCVRACDEVRHTGAITLAGRGETTRIAFGAGGAIHDSSCDFCGSCIDVCPTATLLEKPNKWIAKTETWVSTTCNSCSLGCTISMGVRNGKVVMVKPDQLNPVSWDQICVRGRFHYDAVKPRERLSRHLTRRDRLQTPSTYAIALEQAVSGLASAVNQHGAQAIGVLIGTTATNEEAYAARRLGEAALGVSNIDSSSGAVARATRNALVTAFGTDRLPADLARLARATTILLMADDLESSHNVAALRIKDAVVNNGARLVVIGSRYSEVCDFIAPPPSGAIMPFAQRVHATGETGVWLRSQPGGELQTAAALARLLAMNNPGELRDLPQEAPGIDAAGLAKAAAILREAGEGLAIVYAPNPASAALAGEGTKAAANFAILLRGNAAAESLHVMPHGGNTNGLLDMGAIAEKSTIELLQNGSLKALLVVGDDPSLLARDQDRIRSELAKLECLVTIDSLPTETVKQAHVAFADLPTYGKDGTYTTADRRLVRLARAEEPLGDQTDALQIMHDLANGLCEQLSKTPASPGADASAVLAEIAANVDGYAELSYSGIESGVSRAGVGQVRAGRLQELSPPALQDDGLLLTTSRGLYTSLEGAAINSPEADKLHREEFLEINPVDAARFGIEQNKPVVVSSDGVELTLSAALTDVVAVGSVHMPLLLDGGAINRLLLADDSQLTYVSVRPAR